MIGRLRAVTIDCPDPSSLADFYAGLLGLPVIERGSAWAKIGERGGLRIDFQRVDPYRSPAWPDPERPQQLHFEIVVEDIEAAEARVLRWGARLLARVEEDPANLYRVYADPAGHPFCLEFTA
ncbi:VOC family protein [Nocardiopsis sp. MG754419]|uniref:VOC family protein n=1 Tax=Nocardiopsis sp. MG754419 TaxID=2259865 RepID=UPI001BAA3571|nr:VOC family protein [Nocardiopsis sp. MG754419]MBR8742760.1 VOC family protein [Nocardiopsis sp. MG754419]